MNLDELRNSLASEATEKAKAQEAEIKRLKKELQKKDDRLQSQCEMMRHLFNRCAAITKCGLCFCCGYEKECTAQRTVYKTEPPKEGE